MESFLSKSLFIASYFIVFNIFFPNSSNENNCRNKDKNNYEKMWQEVQKFEAEGLPKSALTKVNEIYNLAIKEKNNEQIIKAVIHRLKYIAITEDEGQVAVIKQLNQDITAVEQPAKAFLNLLLGITYLEYYNYNSYIINQRSVTSEFENSDFKTWDKNKFKTEIIKNFNLALHESLKSIPINEFPELIEYGDESASRYPTVFDFICSYIIQNLQSRNYYYYYGSPDTDKSITKTGYFSTANEFCLFPIPEDSLNFNVNILRIYQKWLSNRISDTKNSEALVVADLSRLKFLKENVKSNKTNSFYEKSLLNLHERFYKDPILLLIDYNLAQYYFNLSSSYIPSDLTTKKYAAYRKTAWELLNNVIEMYPKSQYTNQCINLKNTIENKEISFEIKNSEPIGKSFPIKINYRNFDKIYLTVLNVDYFKFLDLKRSYYDENYYKDILKFSKTVISNREIILPPTDDFNQHSTEYLMEPLEKGFYIIILHATPSLSSKNNLVAQNNIFITDLTITKSKLNTNQNYLYIFNSNTGKPVSNAKVVLYKYEYSYVKRDYIYDKFAELTTDENGIVPVNNNKIDNYYSNIRIDVSTTNDFYSESSYIYKDNESKESTRTFVKLFTDRAIYRPGQTVYFKGICTEFKNGNHTLLTNYTTTVFFKDVNYQVVSELSLKTNEFGSFNGSFQIPTGVLTGNFTIETNGGSIAIKVEEYKRPNFEIEFKPIEGEYRINDSIYAEGIVKSYAGYPIPNAKVKYRIQRNPYWWYYWKGNLKAEEIAFGELTTDDNGNFKIGFIASAENLEEFNNYIYYGYSIFVDATDINGETQSSSKTVYASSVAYSLSTDMPSIAEISKIDTIKITATNVAGSLINTVVNIEIVKLRDPELLLSKRIWTHPDKKLYTINEWYQKFPGNEFESETNFDNWGIEKSVFKTKFNTENQKIKLPDTKKWQPGVYRIILKSVDKWGNEITHEQNFVVFDPRSSKMPYVGTDFFYCNNNSAEPGEIVKIFVGSSYKDIDVYYFVKIKNEVSKPQTLKINSEIKNIEIPITEDCRGGISVYMMFIKNGITYQKTFIIDVPYTNKILNIKWTSFRDKTLPGSKEQWKLKITDTFNKIESAELLASLYDASLDIFAKNYWYLDYNKYYQPSFYFESRLMQTVISTLSTYEFYKNPLPINIYDPILNLFGYGYFSLDYYPYFDDGIVTKRSRNYNLLKTESTGSAMPATALKDEDETSAREEQELTLNVDQTATGMDIPKDENNMSQKMQIRSNFNETAFFYPNLQTDKNGEIILNFTMPESLTRWNFMGLAHTKDLKVGTINAQVVTAKELMVVPNLPRFFRENDEQTISIKINNVSDEQISGTTKIEFYDAVTLKDITSDFLKDNQEKSFTTNSGQSINTEWKIKISEKYSAVGVRIFAIGKNHSDGEERILPVLSNRMLVTEAKPLPVRKAGVTEFKFQSLLNSNQSSTLKNHRFTLEFTSNPAWYAVQALPYIMEYPYECAEQTFSRLYANMLASHIANSNPKIKRVFDIWKSYPDSQALLSNLEKNQELKSLMLEETPWLLDGKDETQRKQRIALLFDLNRMSTETSSAIKKLSEMQTINGGWPWFKGMKESWYITQHIACGFGKLSKLGVTDIQTNSTIKTMSEKAIGFIDDELADSYKELKKYCNENCLKQDNLNYIHIHYLYTRSFSLDKYPIKKSTREAYDYYLSQAEKYWKNKSFYMQGMIAVALYRNNKIAEYNKIIASLKENAITNEEMGMYWKYDRGYYWYQAPIESQAMLIEAFEENNQNKTEVEEMKVWLLKQKQTQDWKTTKATVEAIYALLMRGTDILADDEIAVITIGEMVVDASKDPEIKTEAGTGYFKKSWDGTQVKPEWGNISVKKNSNTVSWGAVYWQYFEQLDKIKHFEETPVKINKKLFVQRRENGLPVIVPIEKDNNLKVGDKVTVRVEIRVDRDMEYVHLKDMRAACFEPTEYLSGYRYKNGLGYYQSIRDASMNFFIDYLRKGTYVFEYELVVSQKGDFSNGITSLQCMYAPEFTSHSEGIRVVVK